MDYVDKRKDKSIDRLWVNMAILVACFVGGYWSLSEKIDSTRQEIKAEMRAMEMMKDERSWMFFNHIAC